MALRLWHVCQENIPSTITELTLKSLASDPYLCTLKPNVISCSALVTHEPQGLTWSLYCFSVYCKWNKWFLYCSLSCQLKPAWSFSSDSSPLGHLQNCGTLNVFAFRTVLLKLYRLLCMKVLEDQGFVVVFQKLLIKTRDYVWMFIMNVNLG